MEKEEILRKAQAENRGKDEADRAVQKDGAWVAYIVGVIALIIVDTVNGFVLHNVNRGADFALFAMASVVFTVKYLKLKKPHELLVAIIWGILSISMLVVWILQLVGVI